MRRVLSITYWLAAIVVVTLVVLSLGYKTGESFFIGTLFLPGALAAKYAYSKIYNSSKDDKVRNIVFVTIGIILGEILLFFIAHYSISMMREGGQTDLPSVLVNPVFIAIIIAVLSAGSVMLDTALSKRFPEGPKSVTFLSDRHSVTLETGEILYVESNDAITIVYAADGQTYRNKTPISAWESILADNFIRIHRSYLVNRSAISSIDKDLLYVGDIELPVSRKYRDAVRSIQTKKPLE